jgi:hypothetical protein
MTDLCEADAITLAGLLRGREVSAREVVAAHIAGPRRSAGRSTPS